MAPNYTPGILPSQLGVSLLSLIQSIIMQEVFTRHLELMQTCSGMCIDPLCLNHVPLTTASSTEQAQHAKACLYTDIYN